MNIELAAQILDWLKKAAPDRIARADHGTAEVWAACLGIRSYPEDLWHQACIVAATELVGDRMLTPKDMLHAAHLVKGRWEVDPAQKPRLEGYRQRRREEFEARHLLRPEDVPKQVHKPAGEIPDSREVDVLAELRRRAAAKQAQIDGQGDAESA